MASGLGQGCAAVSGHGPQIKKKKKKYKGAKKFKILMIYSEEISRYILLKL